MSRDAAYARTLGACIAAGTLLPTPALAEASKPSSRTATYDVAPDCPERLVWRDALRARLTENFRSPTAAGDFTVKIARRTTDDGVVYLGQLGQVSAPELEPRRVQGTSCQEVVEALALIAAMAAEAAAPSETEETAAGGWVLTADEEQALAREEPLRPEPELEHGLEPVRVGAVGFALFQSVGAPRLATDLGVGMSVGWETENLQPWVLVGLYWGGERIRVPGTAAMARFERWSSHIVACPLRFALSSFARLRPCLDVDVGSLTGTGVDVRDAAQSSALWASAGLEVRLEASIGEHLELGAMFGGVLPLARPRFYFEPEVTALEVQAAGARVSSSASLLF